MRLNSDKSRLITELVTLVKNVKVDSTYHLKRYEATMWRAMTASAFFAAFRVSEYLVSEDDTKKLTMERVFRRSDGAVTSRG